MPNEVSPVKTLDPRTAANNDYFNPSDFAVAALGTIGNAGRNPFHGPGLNNMDIVFAKDTKFTENTGWS